jgi:invasion protein IalB
MTVTQESGMSDQNSPPIQPPSIIGLALAAVLLLLAFWAAALADQPAPGGSAATTEKTPEAEVATRGQRPAIRNIKYGDWRKVCFKAPGAKTVCRTTISGTWETGQSAVRADLIEREGESAARLQLFLPIGLYLPAGAKISIDQGAPYRIPYVWCLTNTCIAADVADPKLIHDMETGQTLSLEVVDANILAVTTSLPLGQFAAVRKNAPAQLFEQDVDE